MAIYEKNFDYLAIKINYNDASFILTSSFVIFTMQVCFHLFSGQQGQPFPLFYFADWLQFTAVGLYSTEESGGDDA